MSNSFLSDMISGGVKKADPLHPRNTGTVVTQTLSSIPTAQQLQQQFTQQHLNDGSLAFRPLDSKLNKSFSFTSGLFNLTGLSHGGTHSTELQHRLRAEVVDYRLQWIQNCLGFSPMIVQTFKGDPTPSSLTDPLTVSQTNTRLLKFQYASPIRTANHDLRHCRSKQFYNWI